MNKTVLIIDDDPIVRLVIQKMIHNLDGSVNCLQCDNGAEGLEILERFKNATDAIVVLLDINMPVLNGWEFLESLQKTNLGYLKTIKFYIVTSSTDESDKLKAKSYPLINKVYHKPLTKHNIEEILNPDDLI